MILSSGFMILELTRRVIRGSLLRVKAVYQSFERLAQWHCSHSVPVSASCLIVLYRVNQAIVKLA